MSLMHPNLEPFTDFNDALARLIPFHLLQEISPEKAEKTEKSLLEDKDEEILDKYSSILDKYSDLLLTMQTDLVYSGKKKISNILSPPPDRGSRMQSKTFNGPNNI